MLLPLWGAIAVAENLRFFLSNPLTMHIPLWYDRSNYKLVNAYCNAIYECLGLFTINNSDIK